MPKTHLARFLHLNLSAQQTTLAVTGFAAARRPSLAVPQPPQSLRRVPAQSFFAKRAQGCMGSNSCLKTSAQYPLVGIVHATCARDGLPYPRRDFGSPSRFARGHTAGTTAVALRGAQLHSAARASKHVAMLTTKYTKPPRRICASELVRARGFSRRTRRCDARRRPGLRAAAARTDSACCVDSSSRVMPKHKRTAQVQAARHQHRKSCTDCAWNVPGVCSEPGPWRAFP